MVGLGLTVDRQSETVLKRLAKDFPLETVRAYGRAASIIARKIRSKMNPRNKAVEPWSFETREIRKHSNYPWSNTFGGRLMWPSGKQIAVVNSGGQYVVGWVGGLEAWANKFQDGGSSPTTPAWRRAMYKRGVLKSAVPKVANTPKRDVVGLVSAESDKALDGWVIGALKKMLERKAIRAELKYKQSPYTREGERAAFTAADAYTALMRLS